MVSHGTLADTLRIPDLHSCADQLVKRALHAGGTDNVTFIVADTVPDHLGVEISHFLDVYKELEPDKTTEVLDWLDCAEPERVVTEAQPPCSLPT